jgi:thioredoxin-like negative regulator of GroEL
MDMAIEQGHLAEAEELIERAARARGPEGSALRMLMIPTLIQEGRQGEAERLIESRWRSLEARGEGATEQAVNMARLHMELRWNPPPVDVVRAFLDQVGGKAPDDNRSWLGRANLAIRTGSYDEALRWIDACLRRRPEDPPTWRSRLEWALRTGRLDDARAALKHLPADSATSAEVHRLSARLATLCGDVDRERRELAALVAEAPEDFEAMERLAKLERPNADPTADAELRRRKAAIERDRARYRELHRRNQPARDAEELARLAERLGHPFEALVFLTAAAAEEPDRDDLRSAVRRLAGARSRPSDAGRSLFDRLPTDCGSNPPATGRPAAPTGRTVYLYPVFRSSLMTRCDRETPGRSDPDSAPLQPCSMLPIACDSIGADGESAPGSGPVVTRHA